jgi:AraC-like DNA-binding protein
MLAPRNVGRKGCDDASVMRAPTPVRSEPYATAHDAVFTLVQRLLDRGLTAAQITQATGVTTDLLEHPDGRLPLSQFNALWAYASRELDEPAIALTLHEHYPANRMHFLAHLGMRCATMRDAIAQWGKYALLVSETDAVSYEVHGDDARFIYRCLDPRYASAWFAEHYVAVALFYARVFSGQDLQVRRATFKHAQPGYAAAYEDTFGAPVEFGAAENALVFDAALLDVPFRTADPYLHHFLEVQAETQLERLAPAAQVSSRVVKALNLLLSTGRPLTLAAVAGELALPMRRLRSLLDAEGTSFRELHNDVRRDVAAHYLKQGLTVNQTAYLLGFSEASALQHAVKRWFNHSAGQFIAGSDSDTD